MTNPDEGQVPRVRILGVPAVTGATGPPPTTYVAGRAAASHTARATELIAYLATHRSGVTTAELAQVHSPHVLRSPATLHSLVSRMRRWLGTDAEGSPWLPRTQAGHVLMLDARVRTDWEDFRALAGDDPDRTPTAALTEALSLVHGQPVSGVAADRWGWADELRHEMIEAISAVCLQLVDRHLTDGDLTTARRVAARGRILDPADERIWRAALSVELEAGDAPAQRRLIGQLIRIVNPSDLDAETGAMVAKAQT